MLFYREIIEIRFINFMNPNVNEDKKKVLFEILKIVSINTELLALFINSKLKPVMFTKAKL